MRPVDEVMALMAWISRLKKQTQSARIWAAEMARTELVPESEHVAQRDGLAGTIATAISRPVEDVLAVVRRGEAPRAYTPDKDSTVDALRWLRDDWTEQASGLAEAYDGSFVPPEASRWVNLGLHMGLVTASTMLAAAFPEVDNQPIVAPALTEKFDEKRIRLEGYDSGSESGRVFGRRAALRDVEALVDKHFGAEVKADWASVEAARAFVAEFDAMKAGSSEPTSEPTP